MSKRIYLSVFEVEAKHQRPEYDTRLVDLQRMLEQEGFEIVYGGKFISYEWIEEQLEQCDGIVAVVDTYWQSSTWKSMELTVRPLPIFVVPVPDDFDVGWIKALKTVIVLTGSSAAIAKTIADCLLRMLSSPS